MQVIRPTRRQTIAFLRSAAVLGLAATLSACATTTARGGGGIRTACLLPLTGRAGAVGQSMARAIQLAQPAGMSAGWLSILDTLSTPEGSAAAATSAVSSGAQLIIGPLFGAELLAALPVIAGRIPVIAFTNDPAMTGRGAFVFGVTPSQTTSAIVQYAISQGKTRLAVVAAPSAWAESVIQAAQQSATASGASFTSVSANDGGPALIKRLKKEAGGTLPDAVLLPDGGDAINAFAPSLKEAGIQILGTVQWSGLDLVSIAAAEGAWFAAPDPTVFTPFADAYVRTYNVEPGLLAGLAFDAAMVAGGLGAAGARARDAIVASVGYEGVTGAFKFNADGSCVRRLAILTVEPSGVRVVAPISAA